ncbi:unnamed protein product, partial [Prunus brigantina]
SLSRAQAKWQKPPLGAIKINVAGAFNVQTGTGGGGLIARNAAGGCALFFARGLDPGPKIIEGNTQDVVRSITTEREDRSPLSLLFSDCRFLLSQLEDISIHFIFKESNRVAHRLARLSFTLPETTSWWHGPPAAVYDVLVEDNL